MGSSESLSGAMRMKRDVSGGSSRVFSNAFEALGFIWWAPSMMNVEVVPVKGMR